MSDRGKTRRKRKHLRTYKPKKTHKNKYSKFSRCGIKKQKGDKKSDRYRKVIAGEIQ